MTKINLKFLSRKKIFLSQRDVSALVALYHAGIIAAGHLVRLFWQGKSYGYLRLRMLADAGYVDTKSFSEALPGRKRKKRKLTSFYYITNLGIEAVCDRLGSHTRPAWKNRPPESKYYEHYHMGELWCRLFEDKIIAPQQWLPSRLAKKKLHIAAYTPLHAIVALENKHLAFYYLPNECKKQAIQLLKNFLPRISMAGADNHFIICGSRQTARQTMEIFTADYPDPDIHVLQWEHAVESLSPYLSNEQVFYRELAVRLGAKYGKINLEPAGPLESAPQRFKDSMGRNIYAAELLSGHLATLAGLQHRGYAAQLPRRLYAYLPDVSYYHLIRKLLPEELKWLYLVIRGKNPGEDIFSAARR